MKTTNYCNKSASLHANESLPHHNCIGNDHLKPLACLQRRKLTCELGAKFLIISWHLMHMAKEKVDQCLSEFVWAQACKIRKGLALMDSFQVSTKWRPQNNDQQKSDESKAFLSFFPPLRMIDEG